MSYLEHVSISNRGPPPPRVFGRRAPVSGRLSLQKASSLLRTQPQSSGILLTLETQSPKVIRRLCKSWQTLRQRSKNGSQQPRLQQCGISIKGRSKVIKYTYLMRHGFGSSRKESGLFRNLRGLMKPEHPGDHVWDT